MKTTLKTKRVNTLFAFFKTMLLPLEQMVATFFSSSTQTRLSLTPHAEAPFNNSNGAKKPFTQSFSMAVVLLSLLFAGNAFGQTSGDYRSLLASTSWSNRAHWEIWNGTAWVAPTAIQGYPGFSSVPSLVTIQDGHTVTLNVTPVNAIGALTIGAGTTGVFTVTGNTDRSIQITGNFTLNAGSSLTTTGDGGHAIILGGNLTNAGTLTIGTAQLDVTLNGTNQTISGAGSFSFGGNMTFTNGGTKTVSSALPAVRGILTVNATTTLSLGANVGGTFSPSLALQCGATAGSAISGSGTLTLGGNVTVTTVASGTSGATIAAPIALGGNRTFTVANDGSTAVDLTISGIISGSNNIIKDGAGTMDVTALNTYTGTTTITAGILRASNSVVAGTAGAFGNSTGGTNTVLNGGTLQFANNTFTRGFVITANSSIDAYGSAWTINSGASISGAATPWTLTVGGTTAVGAEGQNLTLSGSINNGNATLSLTKIGTSTVILAGSNGYTGLTTVSGGTLQISANNRIADASAVTVSGGTLDMGSFNDTVGAVTLTSGSIIGTTGALTATSYAVESGTISKILAGTGGLTKSTSGTVILSASNTYTGTTTVSAGTLQYGIADAIATGAVTVSGGTLDMQTFSDTVGAVTLTSGSITGASGALTATSYAVESGTISKGLAGTANLTKTTSGTVTLSGANTYTGTNTISAGIISINSTTALGAAANDLTIASSAVANVDANVTVGRLTLGGIVGSNGTWGFTGSGATNIDATYFTSTAGVITSSYALTTPTVTVTPIGTYTYNGASQGPNAATNTGTGTSYTFSYVGVSGTTYSASATPPRNAGSYTVTATVAADAAYSAASSVATPFTIGTLAIQVTATTNTKVYDRLLTSVSVPSVTSGALQGTDTSGFTQTYDNINVGTNKTLTPSGIVNDGNGGNNYAVTFVASNTGVITPRALTITGGAQAVAKDYDGTNVVTTFSGAWTLTGVLSPDVVTLNRSAIFATKNALTSQVVTSTSTLAGADVGNYTLTQPSMANRTINRKALTITGASAANKVYDSTTAAVVTGGSLVGVVSPDVVTLTQAGTFSSRSVGTWVVTSTSTIGGADVANYSLTQPILNSADITPFALTLSGISAADMIYNGTTTATLVGGTLVGVFSGDTVGFSRSGTFPSKNVGTWTVTSTTTLTGTAAPNYTLTQPTLVATITPKALTISGISQNKVYDGTSTATLSGGTLNGVVAGETINLTLIVNFYSLGVPVTAVGNGYDVISTSTIASGAMNTDLANYNFIQPTLSVRNITRKSLTITGTTTVDKEYDRTNTAILTNGVLNGVVLGDNVTLVLSGRYATSSAGGPYAMTSTSTIIGADSGNYSVTQPTDLTPRSISKVTLTIGGTPTTSDKAYDGTTIATVTGGSLIGVVFGDNITLTQAGIYANKNVGGPYAITPNFSISGGAAGNYDLIQVSLPNASISPKVLTIAGSSSNKVYDGTTTCTLVGGTAPGTLVGVAAGETINLNLIVDYYSAPGVKAKDYGGVDAFDQPNFYDVISTSTIAAGDINTDLSNYTFVQPTLAPKRILRVALSITGVTASNKVYDGTTTATIDVSGVSITTPELILPGETVTINTSSYETADFDTKDVGVGKIITADYILEGPDFLNYRVVNQLLTASITERAITITANDISKCAESSYTFTGTEFTTDFPIPGDITSVTLTSAGSGVLAGVGSYPITVSNAVGPGVANYTISNYLPGTLVVNPFPSATMTNDNSVNCINQISNITFTGSNGTGGSNVQYKFYYTIDGTPYTVSTLPGNNTVTVNVPSNAVRSFVYVLTDVEDVNTSCSKVISGASITVNITLCTQLRSLQCGRTMTWIDEAIQALPVTGATQYRFIMVRTDNPADIIDVTVSNYWFKTSRLLYGKSYNVSVALFIGSWGSPGPICTLTAPPVPAIIFTRVRDFQCNKTLRFMTSRVEAMPVYSATSYEFEVTSAAGTFVKPSVSYHFSLTGSVPGGALPNTAYTIRVRSFIGNTMLRDWGVACVVRTPLARMSETNVSDSIFNVKAFPNPFASHFSLDIESSSDAQVELKVYDMIGRQLEVRKATVSELSVLEVGRNYPSGVYNIVVSQGDKVKSLRMVKR